MDEAYWSAVRTMRLRIAGLLESLSPAEWNAPSLCREWRVRDVAGHLALIPTITTWDMIAVAPRAWFNPTASTRSWPSVRGPATRMRSWPGSASTPGSGAPRSFSTPATPFDVIVHSQDIALPLRRDFPVPVEYSREGLQRVWAMGWPFNARRNFAGLTLRATDTDWTAGAGPEVAGDALSLLLLLTGRSTAVMDALHGPGVSALNA